MQNICKNPTWQRELILEESTEAQNRKVVRVGNDWKPKEDVLELKQKKLKDPLLVLRLRARACFMGCLNSVPLKFWQFILKHKRLKGTEEHKPFCNRARCRRTINISGASCSVAEMFRSLSLARERAHALCPSISPLSLKKSVRACVRVCVVRWVGG